MFWQLMIFFFCDLFSDSFAVNENIPTQQDEVQVGTTKPMDPKLSVEALTKDSDAENGL